MATRGRAYNYTLDRPPLPLSCRTPDRAAAGSGQGHGSPGGHLHNNEPSDDDDAAAVTREPSATAPMIPLKSRLGGGGEL